MCMVLIYGGVLCGSCFWCIFLLLILLGKWCSMYGCLCSACMMLLFIDR